MYIISTPALLRPPIAFPSCFSHPCFSTRGLERKSWKGVVHSVSSLQIQLIFLSRSHKPHQVRSVESSRLSQTPLWWQTGRIPTAAFCCVTPEVTGDSTSGPRACQPTAPQTFLLHLVVLHTELLTYTYCLCSLSPGPVVLIMSIYC